MRLERLADALVGSCRFENAVHIRADLERGVPLCHLLVGQGIGGIGLRHLVKQHISCVILRAVRHLQPDFIAGERENRREDLGHGVENHPQRTLRGPADCGVLAVAVQMVLDDIEIQARERHNAEIVHRMGNGQELVVLIGGLALDEQLVELRDCPEVELRHCLGRGQMVGIEVGQVIEAELCRVAELEIVLADLLEDGVRASDVDMVVGRASPQTADVRAVLLKDVRRIDAVAERLVHRLAFTVDGPAVRDALFEGSPFPQRADCGQKRRLEPAAVLIKTLEVNGRRPEALVLLHGSVVGRAGVEPAVQRVGFLVKVLAAAMRAGEAFGDELVGVLFEPDVRAKLAEELGDLFDRFVRADGLAAVFAVEHGNRQTPAALTRDAPVVALADHGLHAVNAPCGQPAHIVARGARLVLERFDRAEPLRGCAEDDRLLAAPAVRIRVDDFLGGEQHARFLHVLENDGVGVVDDHAGILACVVGVAALVVHRNDHVHAVALAGLIVVCAEAGRGVDAAGTGIHCDIVGENQTGGLGQEGMRCEHVLIEVTGVGLKDRVVLDVADGHDLFDERLGDDVHLAVILVLHDGVALVGVQGDGKVAGQRPDRGRPNDEVELGLVEMAQLAEIVVHRELDVHGRAGIVLILDLRFSQGGLVVIAPVNGL